VDGATEQFNSRALASTKQMNGLRCNAGSTADRPDDELTINSSTRHVSATRRDGYYGNKLLNKFNNMKIHKMNLQQFARKTGLK